MNDSLTLYFNRVHNYSQNYSLPLIWPYEVIYNMINLPRVKNKEILLKTTKFCLF